MTDSDTSDLLKALQLHYVNIDKPADAVASSGPWKSFKAAAF